METNNINEEIKAHPVNKRHIFFYLLTVVKQKQKQNNMITVAAVFIMVSAAMDRLFLLTLRTVSYPLSFSCSI